MIFRTSVIIPSYNEEKRIGDTLEALAQKIEAKEIFPIQVEEVVIVNDGSTDKTTEVVQNFSSRLPSLRIIIHSKNFGKGHAVRAGVKQASSDWLLVADADMSTPWNEMAKLAHVAKNTNSEVVIASRDLKDSQITRHQSMVRETLGRSFNRFIRLMTRLPYKDTQCGFKLFKRTAVEPVFSYLSVDRFAWDVEFLFYAKTHGIEIAEVPVVWEHKEDSRVRIASDGFEMLKSVMALRLRYVFRPAPRRDV